MSNSIATLINQARTSGKGVEQIVTKVEKEAGKSFKKMNVAEREANLDTVVVHILKKSGNKEIPEKQKAVRALIAKAIELRENAMQQQQPLGGDGEPFKCQQPLKVDDVRFGSVAGQENVKEDLQVQYIYPFTFPSLFPSKAKGVMFYGPPGTGKTMLAKAATAEIPQAAFFSPSLGELRGKYEGETEKNIARVFDCAEAVINDPKSKYDLAIVFLDEFDAIAGKRGDDPSMSRSVNALLQAMDGIRERPGVSVIGATNFPDQIDDAVARRFATRIFIDMPDADAREYLVRAALAQAYSLPSVEKSKRSHNVLQHEKYFNNIKLFGGSDDNVTLDFVKQLVEATGATESGEELMEIMDRGEKVDIKKWVDQAPQFGYSASDLKNVMNIAIQNASKRALARGRFRSCTEVGSEKDCYVSHPEGERVLTIQAQNYYRKRKIPLEKIPKKFHDKTYNFDFRVSDIDNALDVYKPTVSNEAYMRVRSFAKR